MHLHAQQVADSLDKVCDSSENDVQSAVNSAMDTIRRSYRTLASQRDAMLAVRRSYRGPLDAAGRCAEAELRQVLGAEAAERCVKSYGAEPVLSTGDSDADDVVRRARAVLLPAAVRSVRPSIAHTRAIAAASRAQATRRHLSAPRVDGDAALREARRVVAQCPRGGMYDIALALLVLSGRRTTEIMNGRSTFERIRERTHACAFTGQLKVGASRRQQSYDIPLLCSFEQFDRALAELRRRQPKNIASLDNRAVSRKYQSGLGQHLRKRGTYGPAATHSHVLRGVYALACAHLFTSDDATPSAVVMRVLGHASVHESIAYTAMHVELSEASRGTLGPLEPFPESACTGASMYAQGSHDDTDVAASREAAQEHRATPRADHAIADGR